MSGSVSAGPGGVGKGLGLHFPLPLLLLTPSVSVSTLMYQFAAVLPASAELNMGKSKGGVGSCVAVVDVVDTIVPLGVWN